MNNYADHKENIEYYINWLIQHTAQDKIHWQCKDYIVTSDAQENNLPKYAHTIMNACTFEMATKDISATIDLIIHLYAINPIKSAMLIDIELLIGNCKMAYSWAIVSNLFKEKPIVESIDAIYNTNVFTQNLDVTLFSNLERELVEAEKHQNQMCASVLNFTIQLCQKQMWKELYIAAIRAALAIVLI